MLGVLFTIPLRRTLIVEQKLAYPEGTATAEVLKVGDAPGRGALQLALAAVLGAAIKIAETGFRLWPGTAQGATYVGSSTIAYVGTNLSPALLGVGYIIGLNIAALMFIGGALSWYVAIPIYSTWLLGQRSRARGAARGRQSRQPISRAPSGRRGSAISVSAPC